MRWWPWGRGFEQPIEIPAEVPVEQIEEVADARRLRIESAVRRDQVDRLASEVGKAARMARRVREVNHLGPALEQLFSSRETGNTGSTG